MFGFFGGNAKLSAYLAVLMLLVATLLIAGAMMLIGKFLGPHRRFASKLSTYECGVEPRRNASEAENQVPIKYATVALIFIIFDVEAAFFLPWAVLFQEQLKTAVSPFYPLAFIGIFMILLLIGLVYAYQRDVFQWD